MSKIYLLLVIFLVTKTALANSNYVEQSIFTTYGCSQNNFICKALENNMNRDSNGCRVSPESVSLLETYIKQRNPALSEIKVFNRIRYFGPVSGKYSYDYLRLNSNNFIITAKVHFKNLKDFTPSEVQDLKNKFDKAAEIWNHNNPFGQVYTFDFQVALKPSAQTVSAHLVKFSTKGPYFDKWSTRWSAKVIAHEFGHVLGLFDEYDYFHKGSSTFNCDHSSLMCNNNGRPKPYHYHLILQRSFCEV